MEQEDKIIEIIKETIKISDLTDRERQIYNIGYEDGIYNKWSKHLFFAELTSAFLIILFLSIYIHK